MPSEIEQLTEAINEARQDFIKTQAEIVLISVGCSAMREFLLNHIAEVTGESAEELSKELNKLTAELYEKKMLRIEDENPAVAAHLHISLKTGENK